MFSCNHKNRGKYDGSLVCNECGVVLDEELMLYVNEVGDQFVVYGNSRQYYSDEKPRSRPSRLDILSKLTVDVCSKFGLSDVIANQSRHILAQMEKNKLIEKSHGSRAVCAIIYLVSRANNSMSPITLTELAMSLGVDTSRLCHYTAIAKPFLLQMNSSSPLPSHTTIPFLEPFILHTGVQGDSSRALLRLSIELTEFAEHYSLVEGRKESSIAAACVILAAQSSDIPINISDFSSKVGLSERMVIIRMNEIKKALMDEAMNIPHYTSLADSLKKSNIVHFIPEILRYYEVRKGLSKPAPPMAYLNAVRKDTERRSQIEEAKARIDNSSSQVRNHELTLDDLIIERLLLHGVSEDRIASTTNTSRLLSLEEEFCIYLDGDYY